MKIDYEKITWEYLDLVSTKEIAGKYGLDNKDAKIIIRNALPVDVYMNVAHKIGARTVASRLKDPAFRDKYSKKMRRSVSNAIQARMGDSAFRKKWVKKARDASVSGNKRIRDLMREPEFRAAWSKKCSYAGRITRRTAKGIFSPDIKDKRRRWSIRGLRRTGKKCTGPLGEKMYNALEAGVANAILSLNLSYAYEKIVNADNSNGFLSIDFFLKKPPVIVEATCWDKPERKCEELKKKFEHLKKIFPAYSLAVVTRASMHDRYKRLLPSNISVLTVSELRPFIAGLNNRQSGVTDSYIV